MEGVGEYAETKYVWDARDHVHTRTAIEPQRSQRAENLRPTRRDANGPLTFEESTMHLGQTYPLWLPADWPAARCDLRHDRNAARRIQQFFRFPFHAARCPPSTGCWHGPWMNRGSPPKAASCSPGTGNAPTADTCGIHRRNAGRQQRLSFRLPGTRHATAASSAGTSTPLLHVLHAAPLGSDWDKLAECRDLE
jgi:hypothetical protein